LESNGEATVFVPVLAHRRQEKMPILDIFASSDHLKSPKEDEEWCQLGDNFCSQDALQMIRNHDDSSDDDTNESDHTHDFSLDNYIII